MTPSVLVLNLSIGFAAMTALCLSIDRHYAAAFRARLPRRRALVLRIAGWAGIAASFAVAVVFDGWNFGPVQWLGALSGGALFVVAILSYRPSWLRPAALAALPLALISVLMV